MAKYLIIGNSAGGIGAAEAIREVDREGSLTIISEEPYPTYSRPLISDYLAGERSLEGMLFRSRDFFERNRIEPLLGVTATRLDLGRRLVELSDGRLVLWERLLLATGGYPIIPPIPGREKEGVFTFVSLDDAQRMERFFGPGDQVVVIGGGLIGISVTEALVKRGMRVVVVEMKERVLNTILDEEASALVEGVLREAGVRVITGQTVAQIRGQPGEGGRVGGVVTSLGEEIACQLVVIAIGVSPRLDLVRGTKIQVNRGIVVDRHMQTSVPHVYACGDVAEAYDFLYQTHRLTPIWPNAYMGGRVAGLNMAGMETLYPGGVAMNALKYFGLPVVAAGMVTEDGQGLEVLKRQENGSYRKVILKDDRVVGLIFAGEIARSGIIFGLMRDGVRVDGLKESLLSDSFGLAHFSEEVRREMLERFHGKRVLSAEAEEEPEPMLE